MPSRREETRADIVGRRLAQLSAELSEARPGPEPDDTTHDGHTRIRPEAVPEVREIPEPGRHAARRAEPPSRWREALADAVPETLRGRIRIGAPQLAVVAVVVAAGLLVTAWWTVRSGSSPEVVAPVPVVTGLQTATSVPSTPGPASRPVATAKGGSVVVDVSGKVRRPGIVVLPSGSRVVDALEAAGGARPRVDLGAINQARVLVDGEQIVVGVAAVPGVAAPAAPSGSPTGPLVDVNTADRTLLEELPGVGPVTAQAIIDWRTEHGAFTSVDELLEVDGIGDATLADLAPYVTI